jgi:heme exporter protein A
MRLEASRLVCIRGGREVFTSIGFSVGGGEALLVTGRNGAGKSSLLRMVAGLVRIEGGRLALADGDADKTIPEQAHYLGHQDALKPSLTVAENLGFWSRYLGGNIVHTALETVGLIALADLPAAYLSAGQRRRLAIARLLTTARPIWLLDEPTAALDREAQGILAGLMRQHLAGEGIIIAAAHGPIGLDRTNELRLGAAR